MTDQSVTAPHPDLNTAIDRANKYHELAKLSMAQGCATMILCGLELQSIKEQVQHGEWEQLFAGAKNRVIGSSPNGKPVCHFNFTRESARRYLAIAEAAKRHVEDIRSLPLESIPVSELSDTQRNTLVNAVRRTADGQTYKTLAIEWGLAKKPSLRGGHHPASESQPAEKIDPKEAQRIGAKTMADAWLQATAAFTRGPYVAFCDMETLVHMEQQLADFSTWFKERLKERRKSNTKS